MSDPFLIVGGGRGRPPRAGVRATKRIEFAVTPPEREALVQMAKANGQTMASVIRDAVNTLVSDYGERVIFTPSGGRFEINKSD